MNQWTKIQGIIQQGYQVASGQNKAPRFPGGTLRMQRASFKQRGLDLSPYFPGTINLSLYPHSYVIKQSAYTFHKVKWAEHQPAEDFSFFDCCIISKVQFPIKGLIYYPHPETKPMHFQEPSVMELLMPFIEGLNYGDSITIELNPQQLMVQWNRSQDES